MSQPAQETDMPDSARTRSSSGNLGIALIVVGLTTLAIYMPQWDVFAAPALVLSGFYLYRRSTGVTQLALGVMATAIGLLLIAAMVSSFVFLPWVSPAGAS
jgi:hypothetical protein